MEKFILRTSAILAILFNFGCAAVEEGSLSGIDPYMPLQGSNFYEQSESKIAGSGSLRFLSTQFSATGSSISLQGSLDQLGSSITVNLYADMNLTNAVYITFTRSGINVTGNISIGGSASSIDSFKLSAYPANLDLVIQVQRLTSQHRVLIWHRDSVSYTPTNARIDSLRPGDVNPALPNMLASGQYSGLNLSNATVTRANLGIAL